MDVTIKGGGRGEAGPNTAGFEIHYKTGVAVNATWYNQSMGAVHDHNRACRRRVK